MLSSATLSFQQGTVTIGKMGTTRNTTLPGIVHSVVSNSQDSNIYIPQNAIDESMATRWVSQPLLYKFTDGKRDTQYDKQGICINFTGKYTLKRYNLYDNESRNCISGSLMGTIATTYVQSPQVSTYTAIATWENAVWTDEYLSSPQNFQSDTPFNVLCYTCEEKQIISSYPLWLDKIGRAHV